jgi:lipoprotein signal peptidase
MKKTIVQGIIFSILAHVLVIVFQILRGYLQTKAYTPSIADSYNNVYMLNNEVAFGFVYNTNGVLLLVSSLLAGVVCYVGAKLLLVKAFAK